MGEDCLHLNAWTPGLRDNRKRPVMVWFHGGAYSSGTSNELETDGERLSRKGDVVVVTVNHRLNAFGYLHLAEFGSSDLIDAGNAGQLDLILALEWVQRSRCGARWRCRERDDLRSLRWRREERHADGDAEGEGPVPSRHHA